MITVLLKSTTLPCESVIRPSSSTCNRMLNTSGWAFSISSNKITAVSYTHLNIWFQVLFHSPPGVLFTFPSQYYALSVTKEYLALRGGPRVFPQGFSCLVVLWIPPCRSRFRLRGFHPLWPAFPKPFCYLSRINYAVRTPGRTRPGLGSSVFARRYLRNHLLFSLPPAT